MGHSNLCIIHCWWLGGPPDSNNVPGEAPLHTLIWGKLKHRLVHVDNDKWV